MSGEIGILKSAPWQAAHTVDFCAPASAYPPAWAIWLAQASRATSNADFMIAPLLVIAGKVGGKILDVLIGQAARDSAHRRVAAPAGFVRAQRVGDIDRLLPHDQRHMIDVRIGSMVVGNAV